MNAAAGAAISLADSLDYDGGVGSVSIVAAGEGSTIDLSGLSSFAGSTNPATPVSVQAGHGGLVKLAGALTGITDITVDAGGQIDVSQITS